MAYAAVSSVLFAIRGLVYSPRISVASSTREILQSATDHARWLRETLSFCGQVVTASDEREIIEESRGLEDAIEFAASAQFLQQTESGESTFSLNLDHLTQHVHRFARAAVKMKQSIEVLWEKKVAKMIEQHIVEICLPPKQEEEDDDDDVSSSATDMIGLSDEFKALRDAIDEHSCSNRIRSFLHSVVFWISGMAGVGKTTLAKRIFHDPLVKGSFECLAFVRVGREYRVERVLQAVLAQLSCGDEKIIKEGDDEDAYESFRRALRVKRCLVVLDDVWDSNVLLDLVKRNREIECMGSCILVTSRMEAVFPYKSRSWKMRFLTEEESWELLKKKVFDEEEEECPPLLVKPGKKIAEKCEGLPLLIIAVANELRSKVQKNLECWNRVAEKPNSVLEEASNQISEVLLPSYNQLDEIYKVFFLYIAVFPQSYQVFCSKIINLWHAEGFQDFVSQFTQDTDKSHALPKLTKLLDVGVESCTREVLDCIPSLKKLRIQIELAPDASETLMCIDHIPLFYNLQSFQGVITNPTLLRPPPPLAIPIVGLRKLSLSGFGYPWEEMSKIAKLPNLYVLKLRCYAFRGERWEANEEMRFSSLRYLYIEDTDLVQWTSGDENFQYLWGLTMKNCHKLHEIPRILSSSMKIELVDCNPLAEACAKQRYGTATGVSFTASYSWNEKKLKSWT